MTLNRGKLAGGLTALATASVVLLVPAGAFAGPGNATDLQANLASSQANTGARGIAAYHADGISSARDLKVKLSGVSMRATTAVQIYVDGKFVSALPVASDGSVSANISKGLPALHFGDIVKVTSGQNRVICVGKLTLSTHSGNGIKPQPSSTKPGTNGHKPQPSSTKPGTNTHKPTSSTTKPGTNGHKPRPTTTKPRVSN